MKLKKLVLICSIFLTVSCSGVSSESRKQNSQTETVKPETAETAAENSPSASQHKHDAHMRMTELRASNPEDTVRAEKIAEQTRQAMEKYRDYKIAVRDGFEILLPEVPQKMYHFNRVANYIEAESRFDRNVQLLYCMRKLRTAIV